MMRLRPGRANRWRWIAVVAALVAMVAFVLVLAGPFSDLYQRVVLANEPSGLGCAELPPSEALAELLDREAALIDAIEQEFAGLVSIGLDEQRCAGRAEIVIHHTGNSQKDQVRQLLEGSHLDGPPIRWMNI